MQIHNLIQGSPEWLAYRAQHFNASDAPAMMGCSAYKTRAELLREMHTGLAADVDVATQKRFDNGHRAEALARPLAEEIIGEELYPVTGSEGRLSASFDGLTLAEDVAFEHKALNSTLRAVLPAHDGAQMTGELPLMYRVQMEQQLLVSGADRVLFMSSEWTADGDLVEERHCWYTSDPALRQQIIDGWAQFERDLAAYTIPAPAAEPARAEPMESLPSVSVRLDGALSVVGNLPTFAVALREFVAKIPARPATDTEFATTEAACKALKKAEEALDAAEAGALASITDVDAMRRAVADCRKLARDTRLAAEKMVERRKMEIKEAAVMASRKALDDHIAALNAEIAPFRLPAIAADFAGTIKGLKSVASMQDKLDGLLASCKVSAEVEARAIRANIATFKASAEGLEFLFADLGTLIHKPADDFAAALDSRIAKHRAEEAAREAQRKADEAARIAQAEQRAREQEAARLAEVQRQAETAAAAAAHAIAQAAAKQDTKEQAPQQVLKAEPATADATDRVLPATTSPRVGAMGAGQAADAAPKADDHATLKLGTICERLGFTVTAAFLADVLHIQHAATDKRAMLYRESQWPVICQQIRSHVGAMAELYSREVV